MKIPTLLILGTAAALLTLGCAPSSPASPCPLEQAFTSPPMDVRPSGYWWWLYNNVDRASITRDLEEFHDKGIGAVLLVCSGNWSAGKIPSGPVFLSPEWMDLLRHALDEAKRLGIKVDMNIAPGWNMGGPWVTPETACRWYLQSEMVVEGPRSFREKLPLPSVNEGYNDKPQLGVYHQLKVPMENADYRDTAVVAFRVPDGADIPSLKNRRPDVHAKAARADGNVFVPPREIMDRPRQPWQAAPEDTPVHAGQVVDLTAMLAPDGTLAWEVPEGRWVVVRTGHRMTGAMLSVPLPGMEGLENDFLDRAGVENFFQHTGRVIAEAVGDHAGTTLRAFASDSFEAGYPNWTANMPHHFKKYRSYDLTPYLPVLRGYLIGSAEISERFLHDYRKTIADCMADEHYRRFGELGAASGIKIRAESAGPNWSSTVCMDSLKNLGRVDFPQGEFWRNTFVVDGQNLNGKQTASAAHIYGHRTASAEALTSQGNDSRGFPVHWSAYPDVLKPLVDRAFCEGINNMVFHTLTAQRPQDGKPGYAYGAGTHFNPNVTWWAQAAKPWLDYINRCQAMLQHGLFVADVLYYNGDGAPNHVEPRHIDPRLGPGYDYDVCNEEVLLTRLSVASDGKLVLPDGMSYRLLVLPEDTRLPAGVAEKIAALVEAGATVAGPRPTSDPGLRDFPECDARVSQVADRLWGKIDGTSVVENRAGRGRVFHGRSLREILIGDGIPPDFEAVGAADAFIDFIHRADASADWYFLCNRNDRDEQVTLRFRQSGRQPEVWNPLNGERRPLPEYEFKEGIVHLPFTFGPQESLFVVFRDKPVQTGGVNTPARQPLMTILGDWQVGFDPDWFYPLEAGKPPVRTFEELADWTLHPDPAVRHFSGTATYRMEFEFPGDPGDHRHLRLSLGEVNMTARVRLNGTDLGVAWCHPWEVDAAAAIRKGRNLLEIEVVNTWQNRLIGDGLLPEAERRTRTNITHFYRQERKGVKINHRLMPSGLRGPVTLVDLE